MVQYSILSNEVPFKINSLTGTIVTSRILDRESTAAYSIVVRAEDFAIHNPLSSTATVGVVVRLWLGLVL